MKKKKNTFLDIFYRLTCFYAKIEIIKKYTRKFFLKSENIIRKFISLSCVFRVWRNQLEFEEITKSDLIFTI